MAVGLKPTWKLYNIFVLSIAFFFIFTAFQTSENIETTTVGVFFSNSCNSSDSVSYGDDLGFYCLCVIYVGMGIFTLLAPPIIGLIGAKATIVISGAFYILIIASLIRPVVGTLFLGSILSGAGGGVFWTAQGQLLFSNSDNKTLGRNTGIFWMFLQSSFIFGNLFYYLFVHIHQQNETKDSERTICISWIVNAVIYGVLTAIGLLGVVVLMFIRSTPSKPEGKKETLLDGSKNDGDDGSESDVDTNKDATTTTISSKLMVLKQVWRDFLRTFQIMCTWRMFLLIIVFTYCELWNGYGILFNVGFELTFWSGVIGTLTARTVQRAEYAGAVGMAVGVGEVVSGFLLMSFSGVVRRIGREPVILAGFISHMISFLLVFYTVPDDATAHLQPTAEVYLVNRPVVQMLVFIIVGFLLGFGDGCYNTQIYSILGEGYPGTDGAPAYTIFQCTQSVAAGTAFLYNGLGQIALKWELLILVISGTLGTVSFILAEWNLRKKGPLRKML